MTHIENNDLKRVMNAMKMRKYRENLSGQKKELYLKKERMRQAKIRLEKKCETQLQHEKNRLHQQKCRLLKLVPESPSKFKQALKAMYKLANASLHKQEIINDCLGHFNFASKSIPQKKPKLSVIQLQILQRQNSDGTQTND